MFKTIERILSFQEAQALAPRSAGRPQLPGGGCSSWLQASNWMLRHKRHCNKGINHADSTSTNVTSYSVVCASDCRHRALFTHLQDAIEHGAGQNLMEYVQL